MQTRMQAVVNAATKITGDTTPIQLYLFNPDGTPFVQGNSDLADMEPAAAQANFAGADVTALKVELNAFLTKLRTAGIVLT